MTRMCTERRRLERIESDVQTIQRALHGNGQDGMRDRVVRLEEGLRDVGRKLDAIHNAALWILRSLATAFILGGASLFAMMMHLQGMLDRQL